jgi:2-polyprenyl-6-methoxyphenol hydroxylase-like FAD-dependent oxidoreductase
MIDVLIIGAGPTGLTLAVELLRSKGIYMISAAILKNSAHSSLARLCNFLGLKASRYLLLALFISQGRGF